MKPHGRFVWHELVTSDTKKAQAFYPAVTGWGTQAWEGPQPYTMWTAGGKPVGGVMEVADGSLPPHWFAHVATDAVDRTVAQAETLGAQVLERPTDIPGVGRFSVLRDPHGAVFAAFTPGSGPDPGDGEAAVGEFSWHELMTTDYEAAFSFYRALFGWEQIEAHDMGPMGVYLIFGQAGRQVGGMFNRPAGDAPPPAWLHYVRVPNVDEAAARVTAGGGRILMGPHDVPGGSRIVQCLDPQGAAFALHHK